MTLSLEKLKTMEPGQFGTGTGTYPELHYEEVRWVASRGGIHDWAIYYQLPSWSVDEVLSNGEKVFTKSVIKRLVPCDDEALAMYRY